MREIKFRAWDEDGRMFLASAIHFNRDGSPVIYDEAGRFGTLGSAVIALMQYTGLKDKNGREIFEGDVIRVYGELRVVTFDKAFWSALTPEEYWQRFGYSGQLPAGFGTMMREGTAGSEWNSFKPLYRYDTPEVVGNVYENPDLVYISVDSIGRENPTDGN